MSLLVSFYYKIYKICHFMHLPLWNTIPPYHTVSCLYFLPLFPVHRSYPAPYPFVNVLQYCFHIGKLEILEPPSYVLHISALTCFITYSFIAVEYFT